MADSKKVPPFNPEIKKDLKDEGEEEEEITPKKPAPQKIKDEEGEGEEEKDSDIEEDEIPVRQSTSQFIIGRQKKTIEKLREKKEDEEEPEIEEEELTSEAQNAVKKAIEKVVNPLLGTLAQKADEDELQDLFTQEPDAKKYEKRIRSYMKNPHYDGVPPSVIFHHLAFAQAETSGANRKNNADEEAKLNRGGGRTLRPKAKETGNLPSVEYQEEMTDAEFENLQHKARTGKFIEE